MIAEVCWNAAFDDCTYLLLMVNDLLVSAASAAFYFSVDQETATAHSTCAPPTTIGPSPHIRLLFFPDPNRSRSNHGPLMARQPASDPRDET